VVIGDADFMQSPPGVIETRDQRLFRIYTPLGGVALSQRLYRLLVRDARLTRPILVFELALNLKDEALEQNVSTIAPMDRMAAVAAWRFRRSQTSALLAFCDFPAKHWKHLRLANPIENTFAIVCRRTIRSKCCLSNKTALAIVYKLHQRVEVISPHTQAAA
jgi:hypothetical protein